MTDDHGDQFPGALPASPATHRATADEQMVRMPAEYPRKPNSLVENSRSAGRRTPARAAGGRRPQAGNRLRRITRSPLQRFDRYTLEVFNPGAPYRRSDG